MKARTEWAVMGAATAIRLWLSDALPVLAIGWAGHDDVLFLRLAESILSGDWLGRYSEMTLIKGCGYPLWIALMAALGIPLLFSQQLLYIIACFASSRALRP